jgi:hypothetical protein
MNPERRVGCRADLSKLFILAVSVEYESKYVTYALAS